MYTANKRAGKFEACRSQAQAEVAYNISLDGCCDDIGEADFLGHYSFIRGKRYGFILCEDHNGFITCDAGRLLAQEHIWNELVKRYEQYYAEQA